jgi:galactokinase/mevalonate kinase-like predicted kinase
MGIICGFQDQHMAAFGGLNFMDFHGKESLEQRDDEPLATVEPLHDQIRSLPIVVAHTGISRNSGIVHRSIRDRWLDGEPEVVEGYKRIAELARMGRRAMLNADWEQLGQLMDENHAIQRSLGGSGPQNDNLIDVARENGALGAKLSGAGHGGTIVALTLEPDRTVAALREAGAERILWPRPMAGLSVETLSGEPAADYGSRSENTSPAIT